MAISGRYRLRFRAASRGRKRTFGGGVFNGEILNPGDPKRRRETPWNGIGLVGLFILLPLCATPLAILLIPAVVVFFVLSLI